MDKAEIKKLAAQANSDTWKHLQKETLGENEKVQMLCCAYSSLYLWLSAGGTLLHLARGHWLISRVCCVIGEVKLAREHSKLCVHYTGIATDKKDFDEVYVLEAEARSLALAGDKDSAKKLKIQAMELVKNVADPEDKSIVVGDLNAEPWFGVK